METPGVGKRVGLLIPELVGETLKKQYADAVGATDATDPKPNDNDEEDDDDDDDDDATSVATPVSDKPGPSDEPSSVETDLGEEEPLLAKKRPREEDEFTSISTVVSAEAKRQALGRSRHVAPVRRRAGISA